VVKVVHVAPRQFIANQLIAPKSVPSKVLMVTEEEAAPAGVIGGIPGGVPGGAGGLGALMGGLPAAAPPKPPPPPPAPPKPTGPAKIGGNVVAANLINPVKPVYPPLAKMARQQGTVKFEAMISKEGTIEDLKLISGPPLLVQAAMDAVKQWRYRPTILNGEPTEVQTTIDVNFSLSN
jgi:protein TonB